jgi:subtilisin family serine protease
LLAAACGGATSNTPTTPREAVPRTATAYQRVIVQCAADCKATTQSVSASGGFITQQLQNATTLIAQVPSSQLPLLRGDASVRRIDKDLLTPAPSPRNNAAFATAAARSPSPTQRRALENRGVVLTTTATTLDAAAGNLLHPASFAHSNILNGAAAIHATGNLGDGVVVAIIDSGTENNRDVVPALADSILGGESFVETPDEPSATSTLNDDHGTWVATVIAGHGAAVMEETSELLAAVRRYAPENILALADGRQLLPIVGVAPEAKIYAMKVFGVNEPGAPQSRTLAAMDRVLTLRRNFNSGMPSQPVAGDGSENNPYVYDSLNIQVVNLSLGGPTLFAGGSIEDHLVQLMVQEGIVVVASAGNEGYGAMTGASPGATVAAVTVGAASVPQQERILRDLQHGPGAGLLYRPSDAVQVAEFSSRGPTADGRSDPDLIASGVAELVQSADGRLALVSGTSFSSPAVAGAAALLRHAAPGTSAADVRAALIQSANPLVVSHRATPFDQGNGFLNVAAALALLTRGDFNNTLPALPATPSTPRKVVDSLAALPLALLDVVDDPLTENVTLAPGEVQQFFISAPSGLSELTIRVVDFAAALPPDQQNAIYGDDLGIIVLDAPTSTNDTRLEELIKADASFRVEKLQPGIIRIALLGDWSNAGPVSATLTAGGHPQRLPMATFGGSVADSQRDRFSFELPEDLAAVNFELSWLHDWAFNPGHDLDLILTDPAGTENLDGATLAGVERVTLRNPLPGKWSALVDGYEMHGFSDRYRLAITDLNGRPLEFGSDDD